MIDSASSSTRPRMRVFTTQYATSTPSTPVSSAVAPPSAMLVPSARSAALPPIRMAAKCVVEKLSVCKPPDKVRMSDVTIIENSGAQAATNEASKNSAVTGQRQASSERRAVSPGLPFMVS